MPKQLLLGKSATNKSIIGINKLEAAVGSTLGAKGNTVIIGKHGGNAAQISKDGVTVSEAFELLDPVENLAATIVKQAAKKTAETAGDGTTTATILAHAIITEGLKAISKGANPMDLKRGIDEAVHTMKSHIKSLSQPVTEATLRQVSIISANGDDFIGNLVADAFEHVGVKGVITVEESKSYETSCDIMEGFQIDKGFISPEFVRGEQSKSLEFKNPFIVLIGQSVAMMQDLMPVISAIVAFVKENSPGAFRPIVFIAENVKDEALATLVVNNLQKTLPCCAIGSPYYGLKLNDVMEDIATLTGATYILEAKGIKLNNATIDMVGTCNKIIISANKTVIFEGGGDRDKIKEHCDKIMAQIEKEEDEREKNFLKGRLARLLGKVAVIKVGGATEIEVLEKRDRIDDAVCAVRSASEEGFVAGGGTTYLDCSKVLHDVISTNADRTAGIQIVRKALTAPFIKILTNAGILSKHAGYFSRLKANRTIKKIQKSKYGFGVNVKTDTFEDLLEAGVIDPAKVAREALENAASVSGVFITTNCILQEIPAN